MKKIILLFLLLCGGLLNAQISLSEIQDTVGKGYVPITDYDPALATYIQKYMLLQDYLEDSISWASVPVGLHDAVTLAGSYDYITLSGQVITRNQIDLTTDVTGLLPYASLSGAPTLLSQFTDDLGHVEESTTVTDLANGLDISLSTYDITVSPDFVELTTETTIDGTDYIIMHDATTPNDGKITYANLLADIVSDGSLDLYQVLTNGNDAGGLDAMNFAEVESDEFIGDLRGAVLFKAQAGETLAKGDVVYVSGISGNTTIVSKADADDSAKMPAFGVVAAAASLNNPVDIYTFGTLSNLNTSAYTLGDVLYVSTTAGQLTATPPTGESALLQNIAKVTRVDNAAGSIKISGAGRTNATPNLNTGRLFVGNASNQAVADGTIYVDIANSRVGIGTSSPYRKLSVENGNIRISETAAVNGSTIGALEFYSTAGSEAQSHAKIEGYRVDAANGELLFYTKNTGGHYERMRIDENGNLGIGASSPLSILDIHDNDAIVNIRDNSDSSVKVRMRGNSANDIYDIRTEIIGGYTWHDRGANLITHYDDVDNYIWRSNGAVERMRLNSTGLGIGTSSPSEKLHVNGTARFGNQVAIGNATTTAADLYIYSTSNTNIRIADGSEYIDMFYNSNATSTSVFLMDLDPTNASGTAVTEMRIDIDNAREVTITPTGMGLNGIAAPSATLDVNGDVEITTVPTENTDNILTYGSTGLVSQRTLADITAEIVADPSLDLEQVLTNGNNAGAIGIENVPYIRPTSDNANPFNLGSSGYDFSNIDYWTQQYHTFNVNGTNKMRISSDGVGFGGVQSSQGHTIDNHQGDIVTRNLQIGSTANLLPTNLSGYWLQLQMNTFSGNVSPTMPDPEAGILMHNGQNGEHYWAMYMASVKDAAVTNPQNSLRTDIGLALNTQNLSGTKSFSPKFTVRANGDVIVGDTLANTTAKFEVNGQMAMRTGATNGYVLTGDADGLMSWTNPSTIIENNGYWDRTGTTITEANAGDDLNFDSGTLFADASTNRVGIGTSSPSKQLTIQSTGNAESLIETTIDALAATTLKNADAQWRIGVEPFDDGLIFRQQDAGYTVGEALKLGANLDVRVYNNLRVDAMTQDDAESQVVVWDSGTNNLRWRDVSTIGDGDGIFDVTNDGSTVPTAFDVGITDDLNFASGLLLLDNVVQRRVVVNDNQNLDVDFIIKTGAFSDAFFLNGNNGQITLGRYGTGAVTGTETYILGVETDGRIVDVGLSDLDQTLAEVLTLSNDASLLSIDNLGDLEVNGEVTWGERALGRINSNNTTTDSDATPDLVVLDESIISINTTNDVTASNYSITVDNTGYYQISISGIMYGSGAGVRGVVYLAIGGTPVDIDESDDLAHEGDDRMSHEATFYMQLTAGQVLTLEIDRTTASGSMTIDEPSLEIVRLMGY